jgi:hypothetical protein
VSGDGSALSWARKVRLSRTGPLQGNNPARGSVVRLAVAWKRPDAGNSGPGKRGNLRNAVREAPASGGEPGTEAFGGPISGGSSGNAEGQTESNQR